MIRKKRKKNKIKKYIVFFTICMCLIVLVSNDFGLLKLIELKKNKYKLQGKIQTLVEQQITLNSDIVELKTNMDYVEKIAREKFLMAKPGEKIFKVLDYKQIK